MSKHTCKTEIITPAIAADWLENHNFERQRKSSKPHVDYLTKCMTDGTFDGGETIRLVRWDGNFVVVNGQHRLRAILAFGRPVEIVVVITDVPGVQEAAQIYARIDRGRGRSLADVLRAFADYSDHGLTQTQAALISAGAVLIENQFSDAAMRASIYDSRSADHRHELAIAYSREGVRFLNTIAGGDSLVCRMLTRRVVLAVALLTFGSERCLVKAEEFWRGAAHDDGLAKDDPRKQLLRFLQKMTNARVSEQQTLLRGVVCCWNAFFENRMLQVVRPGDPTAPLNIVGTRFSARSFRNPEFEARQWASATN